MRCSLGDREVGASHGTEQGALAATRGADDELIRDAVDVSGKIGKRGANSMATVPLAGRTWLDVSIATRSTKTVGVRPCG
jgi:hypothetical protein